MSNSIDTSFLNKYTTTDYSSLLSSLPKKDESTNGFENLATEFNSIRSGSYGKLLSAYYKKMNSGDSATEAMQKETANRQLVGGNASSLKSAAKTLSKVDFYDDSEGADAKKLKAVKDFISAYNSVIDTADDVNSKGILQNAVWMTNITKKSAGLLNELGISIGDNNQLTLDETKWANANNSTKSALFNGRQSFAEKMVYKAGQMTNFSAEKASYTASAYKDNGDYTKVTAQSMYEDLF
ncbi:MAG: hypothetical protein J6K04_08040 [Lachnospiraceae bacterium]|nr:hypothetical protein [Lachnospiraceae bacterium]